MLRPIQVCSSLRPDPAAPACIEFVWAPRLSWGDVLNYVRQSLGG